MQAKIPAIVLTLSLAFTATPAPAQVSEPTGDAAARAASDRWSPWIGCWRLLEESLRDESLEPEDLTAEPGPDDRAARGTEVCVALADQPGAVTVTTTGAGGEAVVEMIVADGVDRRIDDPGCEGSQRAEWSTTGERVFSRAAVSCKGQAPRTVSALTLLGPGPTWIDVQVVDADGRTHVRVRRYQRAGEPPPQASWSRAVTRWTAAAVKEAASKIAPEAVQAALVETNASLDLDRATLIDLDDAGVPDAVIDLMVALSYPDRFVVERAGGFAGSAAGAPLGFSSWADDDYLWWSYYAPFGYRYFGYYDPFAFGGFGFSPIFVPIDAGGGDGGGAVTTGARVVNGRGYTRVRERAPEPDVAARRDSGSVRSASDGGHSSGSSSGSSGGGSAGVSSGGYSSGGGGGGDRTAQPRPPE